MKLLFIGDIFGEPGRRTVKTFLPTLIQELQIDCVIANAENAAGGRGMTAKICDELFELGVDVITSGNHIWDQQKIMSYMNYSTSKVRNRFHLRLQAAPLVCRYLAKASLVQRFLVDISLNLVCGSSEAIS